MEVRIYKPLQSPYVWRNKHWSVYKKIRDAWYVMLLAALGHAKKPKDGLKITLVSYRRRLLDQDNLAMAFKPVVDCLKEYIRLPSKKRLGKNGLGWIYDDSPNHVILVFKQVKVQKKGEESIKIIIKENKNGKKY